MKSKMKKYRGIIVAMIVAMSTMSIQTTVVAAQNETICGSGNSVVQRSISFDHYEATTRFRKGTWYAYSNGGFYFRIHKISGKKMSFSFHMPNMNVKKKIATIGANKKTATAKFRCSKGKIHTLRISISGRSIKVQEKSSCTKKLLGYGASDRKKMITHMFRPDGWIWY